MQSEVKFKTIDLCAGIGGIRRGFELTGGFQNVLSAEVDKFACQTYQHLYGDDPCNDLTSDEFKQKAVNTEYDVLLAGFPCQTFSSVGKKMGFADTTKGTIFFHLADIIEKTRPKAIFLENVDHLLRHDGGKTFRVIMNVLENELDYQVVGVKHNFLGEIDFNPNSFIRNSKNFGVPQNRPRAYIMAFDRKVFGHRPELEEAELPQSRELGLYKDLNDLLEMGAEPQYYMAQGYWDTLIAHRARQVKKGYNFGYKIVNKPEDTNPVASALLATGGSGKERNLVIDWQDDIPGQHVGQKKTELNSECVRFMTPREWGKLQGFINYAFLDENNADHFSFPDGISRIQQYKQFGNSVTIPVIQSMAEFMLQYLKDVNQNG